MIKVGGSLLQCHNLPERLENMLNALPKLRNVIIVGGGELVDTIRGWHEVHGLSEQWSHHASIRLMSETAQLLKEICHGFDFVDRIQDIPPQGNTILDCNYHLARHSGLEPSWKTTSDSIAAEIAKVLDANELWLLKSISPATHSVADWVQNGIVDQHFTQTYDHARPLYLLNLATPDSLPVKGD
ncbi:MAG: hypothetical protein P8J33_17130 [Pirellulaceae bacterium]|nr:hypothetical protein [Pirellulaceae bacterium]